MCYGDYIELDKLMARNVRVDPLLASYVTRAEVQYIRGEGHGQIGVSDVTIYLACRLNSEHMQRNHILNANHLHLTVRLYQ